MSKLDLLVLEKSVESTGKSSKTYRENLYQPQIVFGLQWPQEAEIWVDPKTESA